MKLLHDFLTPTIVNLLNILGRGELLGLLFFSITEILMQAALETLSELSNPNPYAFRSLLC